MANIKSKKLGEKIFDELFGGDNLGRTLTAKDNEKTLIRIEQGADLNVYLGGSMLLDHALLRNNLSLAQLFRKYGARFEAEGLFFYNGQVQINCPSALLTCSCTHNAEQYLSWITQQVPTGPLFPFLNEEGRECNDTPALIYLAINDFPNLNTVLTHAKIKPSAQELHHISDEDHDKYINLCKVQSQKVFKLAAKYGLRSILSWCINQGIKNITLEKEDIRDNEIALFIQQELHKRDNYKQNLTKFTQARHLSFHTKPNRPQVEPENLNCIVPTI